MIHKLHIPVKLLILALSGWLLLVGLTGHKVPPVAPATPSAVAVMPPSTDQTTNEEEWLAAINLERQKAGVAVLRLDPRLNTSAQRKASEMSSEGLDSTPHDNAQGVHGYTYALEAADCAYASENLSWGYHSVEGSVMGWMGSPPHKTAILDPSYQTTGFGISGTFVVEHFCRI